MKNLTLLTLATLGALSLTSTSFARGGKAPKQNKPAISKSVELVESDVSGVQSSGLNNQNMIEALQPGLYKLGKVGAAGIEYMFLIDNYANNPDQFLGIMFPETLLAGMSSGYGTIYQGRATKGGSTVMFSPVWIDAAGNTRIKAESQTDAPVIEISQQSILRQRYPLIATGRNGALDNQFYGMSAAYIQKPELRTSPSNGIFVAVDNNNQIKLISQNNQISLYGEGSKVDNTFNLIPINDPIGKFAALTDSRLNTMRPDQEEVKEQVKKLVVFMSGCFKQEMMMIATPVATSDGSFRMDFYKIAERKILERIFPGKRNP